MKEKNNKNTEELTIINQSNIENLIYIIRGQQVMLDSDLAKIYGYNTKTFNQHVKNNIEKFDEDFMFELTDDEIEYLRSKNLTANISPKSRYNPHVFTEQGIYMLMTVLKGDLAVKQSKSLIRIFKQMKDYLTYYQSRLVGSLYLKNNLSILIVGDNTSFSVPFVLSPSIVETIFSVEN